MRGAGFQKYYRLSVHETIAYSLSPLPYNLLSNVIDLRIVLR